MKQIETIELLPPLTEELLTLLKSLNHTDWLKPSPIPGRTVKDLVSHLIDGTLRKLSIQRDMFEDKSDISNIKSYSDLVNHIQTLNSDWMNVSKRLSPEILIDLLAYSEDQFYKFVKTLDPKGKALFGVAWAGEFESENWFDTSREYTEKWHHQMQIRLALGKPILLAPKYSEPLYDTFMRGLPHLFTDIRGFKKGEIVKISLIGTLNKAWFLERSSDEWIFVEGDFEDVNSIVEISDEIAWKIFTNTDREKEKYRAEIKAIGDNRFADKLLNFVTVMS